jgi:plasmid rolling circle replication initiator protein Rep
MSELLEKYAQMKADQAVEKATKETAEKQQFELIRNLMDSMQWSLDQAMNALKITGEARETLLKRF